MNNDPHIAAGDSLTAPARNCFSIAPSDTEALPQITKAIYVGSTGDLALRLVDGQQFFLFRNVPSGAVLDLRVHSVRQTGTTASDLIGIL